METPVLTHLRREARRIAEEHVGRNPGNADMSGFKNISAHAAEIIKEAFPKEGLDWTQNIPELQDREAASEFSGKEMLTADLDIVTASNLHRILLSEVLEVLRNPYKDGHRYVVTSLKGNKVRFKRTLPIGSEPWGNDSQLSTYP